MDGEKIGGCWDTWVAKKKKKISLVVFAFQPVNGLQVQYMQK